MIIIMMMMMMMNLEYGLQKNTIEEILKKNIIELYKNFY